MKYFIDMTVGVIVGFLPMLIIQIFCNVEWHIWITLLVLGIVFPCLALGIYSTFRYAITNEKIATKSCVMGCIAGEFLEALMIELLYAYAPYVSILHIVEIGEGFNALGHQLCRGLCMIGTIVIAPVMSFVFLYYILKDRRSSRDRKKMQKGEAAGLALYSPPAGYCFIASAVPEFCKSMVSYKEAENSPIVVGFAWAGSLFICLVAAVLIYIVVKGRNIPYVLAAYIAEATLFLLCIKRFQLPFPYIPLAALGGVLLIGAAIYKGAERLFVRWKLDKK
ncbi:MAG: hypothetical protein HDR01_15880 [Lachnospiraceae bacterium]|nr:hypothetical protein [Lachnospiraceae bacterium]